LLHLGKKNLGTEEAYFFDIDQLEERGPIFVHSMSGEPMPEEAWGVAAKEHAKEWAYTSGRKDEVGHGGAVGAADSYSVRRPFYIGWQACNYTCG
jgi:hypothetical protein